MEAPPKKGTIKKAVNGETKAAAGIAEQIFVGKYYDPRLVSFTFEREAKTDKRKENGMQITKDCG